MGVTIPRTWEGDRRRLCVPAASVEIPVRSADIVRGEDGEEGRGGGDGLDFGAAALFAVHEAEDAGDDHPGPAGGLNGEDGRAAGGADIVDDDDGGAGLQEAFDATAGAVGLFGFADQEAVEESGLEIGLGAGWEIAAGDGCPCAGAGDVGDEGVGAHGEAANGDGFGDVLADEVVENEAGEAAALRVESGDAAVDVIVGSLARGEGEVAEAEGVGGEDAEEVGAMGGVWIGGHVERF